MKSKIEKGKRRPITKNALMAVVLTVSSCVVMYIAFFMLPGERNLMFDMAFVLGTLPGYAISTYYATRL